MDWAMKENGLSQRRACDLAGIDPRVYRYRSKRADDAGIRTRLRELASERRRFGYRRLHILLKREGVHINWKKLYRLCKEERLTVRKRGGRKRALGTRAPITIPQGANQRWSLDFDPMHSPTAVASASCALSTTSPASVWPRWPITRSPAFVLSGNWTGSVWPADGPA